MSRLPEPRDVDELLAGIRDLAESLPSRAPTTLRVGPYVRQVLRQVAHRESPALPLRPALPGIAIVEDQSYAPGQWRLFDQWGDELDEGHLWPPEAPVFESVTLPPGIAAVIYSPPEPGTDLPPLDKRVVIVRAEGADDAG